MPTFPPEPRRTAATIGALTAVVGVALLADPDRSGAPAGLTERTPARLIGFADVALAPGLLVGRPRWPWMAARGAASFATGAYAVGLSRRDPRAGRARFFGLGLMAIAAADAATALQLRSTER